MKQVRFLFTLCLVLGGLVGLWGGAPAAVEATSFHTIVIDGTNDFTADETMPGTSGSTWYMTWSATHFYFGINASDVGSGSATRFVNLYLDTDPQQNPLSGNGTSTGVLYNTQQPGLSFNADYHFRWQANNAYTNMLDWNNGTLSWTDDNTGNNNFGITAFQSGNYLEVAIPRASLGNPTAVYAAGSMINEQAFNEYTFFMFPNGNSEGYDANYPNYRGFSLNGGLAPNHVANNNCRIAYQVTSTASSGANTLMEAVNNLCNDGNITFSIPANSTITFASQATLNRSLFINGTTATNLTVSGGDTHRIFEVTNDATARMAGFTISNGNGFDGTTNGDGGAMLVSAGATALLTRMTIANSTVASTFYGGGISNAGSLSLTESTIRNNTAASGIANFGSLQISRSVFYGNDATTTLEGGGLSIDVSSPLVIITNSTFANNTAYEGGAIRSGATGVVLQNNTIVGNTATAINHGGGLYMTSGSVLMSNNILGDNSNGDCVILAGTIPTNTNNIIENTTDCTSGAVGLLQVNPLMSELADNGGPTLTRMPRLDSPAVNSADCTSGPMVDQRNETRPQNNTCDRGAVEVQSGEETLEVCGLQAGQTYHFLATGAKIEINTLGDLTCLDVTITDAVHPMASPNIPAPYVAITTTPPTASGYSVTLTLLHNNFADPDVCKYPGGIGGAGWDCARTGFDANSVWRAGIGSFSDWAVGNEVGPTAVTNLHTQTSTPNPTLLISLLTTLLTLLTSAWLWLARSSTFAKS